MTNSNLKLFEDRKEAGRKLAKRLEKYRKEKPVILALPRGGVPVGYEIAKTFKLPFDVIIVRKIGSPNQPELGIGAVAEGNVEILDKKAIKLLGLNKDAISEIIAREKNEIERRKKIYRENKPLINIKSKTVILVDDGLATGITAKAAILAIKKLKPKKIIFASPVCAFDSLKNIENVDEIQCILTPHEFNAVGSWYKNFDQVTDEEVKNLLR